MRGDHRTAGVHAPAAADRRARRRADRVEEPISEWDLDGHARVTGAIDAPLAAGEMCYRPERFEWLLSRRGLTVARTDLLRCGGVAGPREVADLAAAPTCRFVEYIPEYDASEELANAPEIRDGTVALPDEPGHGYSVRDAARAEFGVSFE